LRGLSLRFLKVGDQVGKLLGSQSHVQSLGYHRNIAHFSQRDVAIVDDDLVAAVSPPDTTARRHRALISPKHRHLPLEILTEFDLAWRLAGYSALRLQTVLRGTPGAAGGRLGTCCARHL